MESSEIWDRLREVVIGVLNLNEKAVKPEAEFIRDLGADSLKMVELGMEIEDEFNIEIPDEDAEEIVTVGDLHRYLVGRFEYRDLEV